MKRIKYLIPIIILIIILVVAASFPLTTYLKEYNHSKELYERALEIFNSNDAERHSKALKILHNVPGRLVVLRNKDGSAYITVDNPYRKLDDNLTYEIEEDYKVSYRSYLNNKYEGSLIAYFTNYWELNFADLDGEVKTSFDFTELNQGIPFEGLKWSPDGKYIVFSDSIYLYLFDVISREVKKLAGGSNRRCKFPSWSKNGREILYVESMSSDVGEIRLIDIISGKQRLIKRVGQKHVLISYPLFFDNDRKIIFSNGNNNFEIIEITGKTINRFDVPHTNQANIVSIKDFKLPAPASLEHMSISNDKEKLYFNKGKDRMLNLKTMEVVNWGDYLPHSFGPDENYWLHRYDEDRIIIDSVNRASIELVNGTSPAWSPILSEEILSTFN